MAHLDVTSETKWLNYREPLTDSVSLDQSQKSVPWASITAPGKNDPIQILLSHVTQIGHVLCKCKQGEKLMSTLFSDVFYEESNWIEISYLPMWPWFKCTDAFLGHSVLLVCLHFFPLSGVSQLTARGETASRAPPWAVGPCHCSSWPFRPRSRPPSLYPIRSWPSSLNYYSCPVSNHCRWWFH